MTAPTLNLGPATMHLAGVRAGDRNQFHIIIKQQGEAVDLTGHAPFAHAGGPYLGLPADRACSDQPDNFFFADGNAVANCERRDDGGANAAFEMKMQFGFR